MSWVRVDAPPQQRAQSRPARPRPVAAVDLRSTVAEVQAALSGHGRTGTASHWEHRLRASLVVADSLALLGAVAASTALQSDVPVTLGLLVVPVWLLILASQERTTPGTSGPAVWRPSGWRTPRSASGSASSSCPTSCDFRQVTTCCS
jgi:hypothetical protein